jgi:hypothetical protein
MLTVGLCAVVAIALGLMFWGVHRLERVSFDRGTEFGNLLARVASESLPVRAILHQDLTKQTGQEFSRRGRTLTVEGFHECDGGCGRREHPADELWVDVVVT